MSTEVREHSYIKYKGTQIAKSNIKEPTLSEIFIVHTFFFAVWLFLHAFYDLYQFQRKRKQIPGPHVSIISSFALFVAFLMSPLSTNTLSGICFGCWRDSACTFVSGNPSNRMPCSGGASFKAEWTASITWGDVVFLYNSVEWNLYGVE